MLPDCVSKLISCGSVGRSVAFIVGSGFGGCFSPCHSGNQTPWLHCSFPTPSSVSEQTSCDLVVTAEDGGYMCWSEVTGTQKRWLNFNIFKLHGLENLFQCRKYRGANLGVFFKRCVICTACIDVNLKVAC